MSGHQPQKISLQVIDNHAIRTIFDWVFPFGCGMLAYALHGVLKNSLGIPGHHGLLFMAFLVLAKTATHNRAAGIASSVGVGAIMLMGPLGFTDPFRMITYMLPGLMLDAMLLPDYRINGKWYRFILPVMAGGLSYMMIPLFRIAVTAVSGLSYPAALKHGIMLPLVSFFLFGLLGSLAGYSAQRITRQLFKK